jgi:hypothetical protein
MRDGTYIVDSIENGTVKLLFADDETVEEFLKVDAFSRQLKQGSMMNIQFVEDSLAYTFLESETKRRKEYAEDLMNKLKNKE